MAKTTSERTVSLPRGVTRTLVTNEEGTVLGTAVVDNATGTILAGTGAEPEPQTLMETLAAPGPLGVPNGAWALGALLGIGLALR